MQRIVSISEIYKAEFSGVIKNIISYADTTDFFDEERRALSYSEIENPNAELEFDFISERLIPVIDAYDITYIVYVIDEGKWAKFNIVDKSLFKKKDSIEEVI